MHLGRKTLSLLLSLALMLALLPLAAIPAAADTALAGSGTVENPYQIGTKAELEKFRDIVNGANGETKIAAACAVLTTDIDLGGIKSDSATWWTPIGNTTAGFTGIFDGQGHSITGLYVTGDSGGFSGLFRCLQGGGRVKNLGVSGTISLALTDTPLFAGGIVGYNLNGTVMNCRSAVNVTVEGGNDNGIAGGVVGYNLNSTVTNCYATCAVTASGGGVNSAGGVVGYNNQGTVTNCYATCAVTASGGSVNSAGGVVGRDYQGAVTGCYYNGEATNAPAYAVGDPQSGTGKLTAAQFKDPNNFKNGNESWDFADTWVMGADAPLLQVLAHTDHDGACAHDGWIAWGSTTSLPDKSGAYYLTGNVTLNTDGIAGWEVPAGTTLLCLNGHSITGNSCYRVFDNASGRTVTLKLYDEKNNSGNITSSTGDGVCFSFSNGSSFKMYGGTITHCMSCGVNVGCGNSFTLYGGRICENGNNNYVGVYVEGTFTMYGGEISGNHSTGTAYNDGGGGVQVYSSTGTFTMYGGAITGNTAATNGGGVDVYGGTFLMYGGTITGNTAKTKGGGVSVENGGTFTMSGDAQIYGNVKGGTKDTQTGMYSGGTASNVYLSDSKTITVTGALTGTTPIGVTMAVPGTFTYGLSGHGDTTYFVSDDTAYGVRVSDGEAELYQPGVTFFAVNGTDASTAQVLPYNKATALAANAFTRAGWRFVNWNTAEDGSGDAYADGQDVTLKDDLTLFAQWTANQFTVDDIPAQTADGTAKTPAVTVRDAADAAYVLTQDTHYTLSYLLGGSAVGEIKDAGTYTVRVAGAGYYCAADTVDKTFTLSAPEQQPAPAYYDPGPAAKPVVQTFAPVMEFDGGTVSVSPEKAKEGDAVALTATPDEGNRLWSLAATRADAKPLMLTSSALGEASFTMPGCAVTVNAVFAALDAPMPTVVLSPQKITVNGVEATVEAYNIGGTNFFRLRDLAALLRGTPAQFDVDYDAEANAVVVTRGAAYAGEVNASFTDRSATAVMSPQTVYVDGAAVELTACNIGGYNFFGLRELAAIFGYAVGYDAATNTAIIESK